MRSRKDDDVVLTVWQHGRRAGAERIAFQLAKRGWTQLTRRPCTARSVARDLSETHTWIVCRCAKADGSQFAWIVAKRPQNSAQSKTRTSAAGRSSALGSDVRMPTCNPARPSARSTGCSRHGFAILTSRRPACSVRAVRVSTSALTRRANQVSRSCAGRSEKCQASQVRRRRCLQ